MLLATLLQKLASHNDYSSTLFVSRSVLDVSYNGLQTLPASLSDLVNLRVLLLDHNELSQGPDGLEKCRLLTKIDISYNNVSSLPEAWAQLPALQRIVASNNQLRSVPVSFGLLRQLKEFDLRQVHRMLPISRIKA